MKRTDPVRVVIGDYTYYIVPFAAFTAANLSGELATLISPMLAALAPLVGTARGTGTGDVVENVMNMEVEDIIPSVTTAFSSLSGDKCERLLRKMLVDHQNISVEGEATGGKAVRMSMDLANEIFCGCIEDMYRLCWEVIKLNFSGFFKKIGALSGGRQTDTTQTTPTSESGEIST